MGVSVSYNGSGGRRSFNLDGVPTGDAAKTLGLPQKKHYVPDTLEKMLKMPAPKDPIEEAQKGKVKLNELDANPGTLADKMLPGGGVVASPQGVCLRGEEQSPLVNGVQLFGSVNGSKKYHTIDEIDPKGQPHHVGAKHGDETPEPNNEPVVANQPQSYQVASRIVAERDDIAGLLKLYELDKDVSTSSFGRTVGVTAERRRMICAIRLPRADDGDDGPLPYEVRWDAELDDGDGGWKIFLPTSHLLAYNGSYVTHTGVTAMSGGWYSLDDVERSSTHVWLVLSVVDATGVASAELSPTQGQSVTGTTVYNICVAEISYTAPAAAGDQPTVVIKQSLVGALHLGGGGGGGGGGGCDCLIRPFNISGGKVCNCRIYAPDTELTCGDYTINPALGDIYVHIDRTDSSGGGSSYGLSVDQVSRNLTSTHAQWRLYVYANGAATLDCRPGVLPVFSLS